MWNHHGIVRVPALKLREHPFAEASVSDEVLYGMEVRILGRPSPGWGLVETEYGYRGYAELADVDCREWGVRRWQKSSKYMVVSRGADVFDTPGYRNPCFLSLPRGSRVAFMTCEACAGWTRVRLADGRSAYMRQGQLHPAPEPLSGNDRRALLRREGELRKRLVEAALSYLHTPYRWGGKTPWGIDCSGLCSMAYLLCGVSIWRDAKIREGYPVREIPVCAVKPGDLLYFPGHMALYTGGLEYVHATGRSGDDGVVISSLDHRSSNYRADLAESVLCAGTVF